ncbi:MAG TPA: periplasmic heavy metal sensor [Vicinamibacterales bacterium]|nr:periplasmic heavy metal sensor [Vicinamibacterales bacterium]
MERRRLGRLLFAIVFSLAAAGPAHAQSFGFPWWRDAQFQKELVLTADQSTRLDALFQANMPGLRQGRDELDRQESELSRMITIGADEKQVTKQIDRVETLRASLNKTRTLMLLHMRQVLTPDQRVKLNKLYEQREKDRDKPRDGRGRGRQ